MSAAKYYTQFRFTYEDGILSDEFQGVIELDRPLESHEGDEMKQVILRNFVESSPDDITDVTVTICSRVH